MGNSGRIPAGTGLSSASPIEPPSGVSPVPASIPCAAKRIDQQFKVAEKFEDYRFSPDSGLLRLHAHSTSSSAYWSGDFVDYRGIVTIQMEDRYLRLDAVANSKCHVRSWKRGFGDRTVARLCRAFLTDLFGAPAQGTEARRAETVEQGSVHDGPVAESDAPNTPQDHTKGEGLS